MSKEEKKKLKKIFTTMDVNGDGTLTLEELSEGYRTHLGNVMNAHEMGELFAKADKDKSGTIDWNEFCIIAANKADMMSKDNLKKAFNTFDKDKSGTIDANELAAVLHTFSTAIPAEGSQAEAAMVKEIMDNVDVNKDGVIDFEEFTTMMEKIVTAEPVAEAAEGEAKKD